MKKVVLITGTSSGLGLSTSILLAQNGYKVYATMRNLHKKDLLLETGKSKGITLEVLALDHTKRETIDICIKAILDKEGKIDLLINNAGAGFAKTTEQMSEAEMQWVMDTNYFGAVRCMQAVLPVMRKQEAGLIVNVTSVGGLVGQPFNEAYCAAKFAVEGHTEAMATYIDTFGIKFVLVEPGGISSEFMKTALQNTITADMMTIPPYQHIMDRYLGKAQKRANEGTSPVYQTPEEVAKIILDITQKENPPLRVRTSEWAENFTSIKTKADPEGKKLIKWVKEKLL